jgi:hypothetical protein
MPDDVTAERIAVMAAAGRVPLEPATCARVARTVGPTVKRFADAHVVLAFEVEPSSLSAIARRELDT